MTTHSLAILPLAVAIASWSCGGSSRPANAPSDEDVHAADMKAAEDLRPLDGEQTGEPDMEFFKDMAQRSARQAAKCNTPDNAGPRSDASVRVAFLPIGRSGDVKVAPPHQGTPIGDCIDRAFRGLITTPFQGAPVVVEQAVRLQQGNSTSR